MSSDIIAAAIVSSVAIILAAIPAGLMIYGNKISIHQLKRELERDMEEVNRRLDRKDDYLAQDLDEIKDSIKGVDDKFDGLAREVHLMMGGMKREPMH